MIFGYISQGLTNFINRDNDVVVPDDPVDPVDPHIPDIPDPDIPIDDPIPSTFLYQLAEDTPVEPIEEPIWVFEVQNIGYAAAVILVFMFLVPMINWFVLRPKIKYWEAMSLYGYSFTWI